MHHSVPNQLRPIAGGPNFRPLSWMRVTCIFWSLLVVGETLARTTVFTAIVVFGKLSAFSFRLLPALSGHI